MEHVITAKNTSVTDPIRAYVEKRFAKFDKYAPNDTVVHTKIEVKDGGKSHKVEVTIMFGKQTLRAEASGMDMYAAIDAVEKTMARLLKKRKEKAEQYDTQSVKFANVGANAEQEYDIRRTKVHRILSMSDQEACEAMEMIGHSFYVYVNVDNDRICAVYRRENNTYGKIVYE